MDAALEENQKFDILIVDDVRDNIRLLSDLLVRQGYNVRKATTGRMALRAIEALAPDLILLDIKMADMNGYEICSSLKANPSTCAIPVIFLSAADELADKVKAFQVGGIDYIPKPFHLDEVLIKVKTQLTIYQLRQQLEECESQLQQALNQLRALGQ
ncbi:response regulator [Leptolyngbya sp. 7M]|uniref:response regulator n=1 Tax=Leptolyngbya sp. 7M TaxID=2812896 RepID=UPI001B8ACBA2|nr:response regulator [Leptolyngbya sp. 7M]QYO67777.1 response regulator [Leptolyngbya sp. 7M]